MIFGFAPGEKCPICLNSLSEKDKSILCEINVAQSWCLTCMLKYITSYPLTAQKIELRNELNQKKGIKINHV